MKGYFYRHEREESGGYGWIAKGLPLLTVDPWYLCLEHKLQELFLW